MRMVFPSCALGKQRAADARRTAWQRFWKKHPELPLKAAFMRHSSWCAYKKRP
jgi:hypothetical protein